LTKGPLKQKELAEYFLQGWSEEPAPVRNCIKKDRELHTVWD